MSSNITPGVIEMAMKGLPEDRREVFEFLMERGVVNLEWYLRTKIVGVAEAERNDHMMVLKYAYYFCLKDATVTLLRESPVPGEKMPDIEVAIGTGRFYVEVKKFREGSASDPVSKIVHAATIKRSQLRSGEVGFIALHNFDIRLEVAEEGGLTHSHIFAALCELQCRATQNPPAWEELGGVIFAANSTGGAVNDRSPGFGIPHFLWLNEHSVPAVPNGVADFLLASLPTAKLFDPSVMCGKAQESSDRRTTSRRVGEV